MMTSSILDARNGVWADAYHTAVSCEVKFSDALDAGGQLVWLPYVATPDDPTMPGRQLFTDFRTGVYGDIAEFVITPEMIQRAKDEKRSEINQWRNDTENTMRVTFSFNDHQWDCSKESQYRIAPVAALAKNGQLPDGFFWTDADNTDVPVTPGQLIELAAQMEQQLVMQGFRIHERQRQMKKDVQALTGLKAIYDYPVDWHPVAPSAKDAMDSSVS